MPMPRNLKTLFCSGVFQPKPYVAAYSTPFSMTRPIALNSRKRVISRVRRLLSRSRYVK